MAEITVQKDLARERLEQYLAMHEIKVARTTEELYAHSIKDDDGEEVDEFLQILEKERKTHNDSHREIV